MTQPWINEDVALAALAVVVTEKGVDFLYEKPMVRAAFTLGTGEPVAKLACVYAHAGRPSCGVGQALAALGFSIEKLEGLDTMDGSISAEMLHNHLPEVTVEASEVFCTFQTAQDNLKTFGEALATATLSWRRIKIDKGDIDV